MPLSHKEKERLAREHINRYYPESSKSAKAKILEHSVSNFNGNYSPIKKEQESPHGLGSGLSFEEFVIYIGWINTNKEWPKGVERERLGKILTRALM